LVQEIANDEGLSGTDTGALIGAFLEHHGIDPSGPAPVVSLRSGYQILAEGDDGQLTEDLIVAIVGESIQSAMAQDGPALDWPALLHMVREEIASEVDHVQGSVHDASGRALLNALLARAAWEKMDELILDAFPHLKAGPDLVESITSDMKATAVLVLGKDNDDESMGLLRSIQSRLEARGRAGLLLKDQQDIDVQGLRAKLLLNAALSRFVVVENSTPSGHLYELPLIDMTGVVVAVLQQSGKGASFMPDEAILTNAQWQRFVYQEDDFDTVVEAALDWAEERVDEISQANRSARPWQDPDTSEPLLGG
jgi:hypothetical protein